MKQRSLEEDEELQRLLDEYVRLSKVANDALSSDNRGADRIDTSFMKPKFGSRILSSRLNG
jgi:hypothetical protein